MCFWTIAAVILLLVVVYYVIDWALRSLTIGKITDKHVLVTGCDTGFGHLAAIRLDRLGFHVFAGCLTEDGTKSLSEKCSSRLTSFVMDVSSTESIQQALELVKRKLPPETGLWAVINNAGILGPFVPTEFCRREDYVAVLNVNLLGAIDVTRHFLPLLRQSRGRVVNTSSISGRLATGPTPYAVSKYGMECFSDKLRREVYNQGIQVSVVEPGGFLTSILSLDDIVAKAQKAFDTALPEVQTAYGGHDCVKITRDTIVHLTEVNSPNLNLVVDVYIHAVISKFPRTRYPVGRDAKLFYIPVSYLPDGIADFIMRTYSVLK